MREYIQLDGTFYCLSRLIDGQAKLTSAQAGKDNIL
jgi:hypothetical protein